MSKRKKRTRKKKGQTQATPPVEKRGNHSDIAGALRSSSYRLDLEFAGPLLSKAAGTLAFQVDTAMQRYHRKPVINGSLIRGNLRHALHGFAELLDDKGLEGNIVKWFGAASGERGFEPQRGSIDFDFFWKLTEGSAPEPARRTRIAIEEDTGRAKPQHLQIIEDLFPLGTKPCFRGTITIHYRRGNELREALHWLGRALDYIPAMGSFKGIGFGRLIGWKLEKVKSPSPAMPALDGAERVGFRLRFDTPFCLGRPRTPDSNRIVSSEVVSGNVLKGVLARRFDDNSGKLGDIGLDELTITHALPAHSETAARPLPMPLSLATLEGGRVADMACVTDCTTLTLKQAPTFAPDWKRDNEERAKTAWYEGMPTPHKPGRLLSVRTGIDPKHGVAEEGNLFSQECIDPQHTVWCGDLELTRVPAEKRERLLKLLAGPLSGIGKTRARAWLSIQPEPFVQPRLPQPFDRDHYLILLVSPARLLPPGLAIPAINGHCELRDAYRNYWQTRVHEDIELLTHFSREQPASDWPHRQRHGSPGKHHTTWLTCPGTVFLLRAKEQARQALADALRFGLPASLEADGDEPDWSRTPWLPEHGYGEIVINHPRQLELRYRPEEERP